MDEVIEYLMRGDPAIRWQVMRDLTDASADAVSAERARVATEGWGARLLAEQADDGRWDGGVYRPGWADESRPFFDAWTATHFSLQRLWEWGLDPESPEAQRAVARVRHNVRWDYDDEPYFDGEVEPCINGIALGIGAYFGQRVDPIVATILRGQLPDGGWNCWDQDGTSPSSFHSTICVLEGLLQCERAGGASDVAEARRRAEEYLLDRSLLRRATTGEIADPRFTMASWPAYWYYDFLRALDYFRLARPEGDPRCAEAIALLRSKRRPTGMFPLENTHQGATPFALEGEGEGFSSRWVTLRALRVLRWWDAANA